MHKLDMNIIKEKFRQRFKRLRESKNLSQEELAYYLDISRNHVCNLESGVAGPSVKLLVVISNFFNCTTDYLLGKADHPENATFETNDIFEIIKSFNEITFEDYEVTEGEKEKIISAIKYAISIVKLSN